MTSFEIYQDDDFKKPISIFGKHFYNGTTMKNDKQRSILGELSINDLREGLFVKRNEQKKKECKFTGVIVSPTIRSNKKNITSMKHEATAVSKCSITTQGKVLPRDKFCSENSLSNTDGSEITKRLENVLLDVKPKGKILQVVDYSGRMCQNTALGLDDEESKEDNEETKLQSTVQEEVQTHKSSVFIYSESIYRYLLQLEKKCLPKPYYMKRHTFINYSMRAKLVDWLAEVREELRLRTETFFKGVSYLDRFLSRMSVTKSKLQLVGVTALWIAAKLEERNPPSVKDWAYLTDDACSWEDMLRMERILVKTLNYDMSGPTPCTFVYYLLTMGELSHPVGLLSMYIAEVTMYEGDPYLEFCPSAIAAGSVALARHCYHLPVWPCNLKQLTGYSLLDLSPLLVHLNKTHFKASSLPSTGLSTITDRYGQEKYEYVAFQLHKKLDVHQVMMSTYFNAMF